MILCSLLSHVLPSSDKYACVLCAFCTEISDAGTSQLPKTGPKKAALLNKGKPAAQLPAKPAAKPDDKTGDKPAAKTGSKKAARVLLSLWQPNQLHYAR